MEFYSLETLKRIAEDRGYMTTRAVADALQPYFGITTQSIIGRIEGGNLTKEQCEVIGSFFEMTPKEYYECFMTGFFKQTPGGKFICEVEDPFYHIKFSNKSDDWKRREAEKKRRSDRIIEELKNM